jgi:drug/metabolite transporter (DMT)-like permease
MSSPQPVARTYTLIASMVFFSSLGNVLLSKGMKQIGEVTLFSVAALEGFFLKTLTSATIWMGIFSLLAFLVSYLLVLSWADFSYVQPVSAIGYALVAVLSYFLLGEIISPTRWVGVLFICGGVALVSGTEPRTAGD